MITESIEEPQNAIEGEVWRKGTERYIRINDKWIMSGSFEQLAKLEALQQENTMKKEVLVKDAYNIDIDDLEAISEENDWMEKSYDFYLNVKDMPEAEMSPAQRNWLLKIERRLEE